VNIAGSAFCENCGTQLSGAQPAAPQEYQPPVAAPTPPQTPPPVPAQPEIQTPVAPEPAQPPPAAPVSTVTGRLVIQAANASLPIPEGKQTIVIGREDPVSGIFPDIDLDPYGAQEEGVGRQHAQLVLQAGQVCIEDLESVNGTVVNKQRITAHQPHPISEGDEIRLGKMVIIYHAS
jgi:pSer/pThr/pTyr-binding forkhead associated (FHA) protein